MLRKLQEAMERGFSVIIENMAENIDPVILPVVSRAFIRRSDRNIILLGDDEVEQHPDFRLFLHTKLSNPHFPPEIQAETTMVNFMVTPTGLEDQLLSVVIKSERSDLAAHKTALLQQQNQFKVCGCRTRFFMRIARPRSLPCRTRICLRACGQNHGCFVAIVATI